MSSLSNNRDHQNLIQLESLDPIRLDLKKKYVFVRLNADFTN